MVLQLFNVKTYTYKTKRTYRKNCLQQKSFLRKFWEEYIVQYFQYHTTWDIFMQQAS